MTPAPYWHLRGRARAIAKAKWCKYYEDDRETNPLLVFHDLCRKYNLEAPECEVTFDGDRLRLTLNGRSEILPRDATYTTIKLILHSLLRARGESSQLTRCAEIENAK